MNPTNSCTFRMNIDRFDSDRNDDNKYTRAMYFDMLELYKKAPRI